ncbi:MAG TPA: hypothetical protein VK886_12140 [Vicinamibacterales bacterium]|nr:hypothetical protein [Vicinamibacterales bacterium]
MDLSVSAGMLAPTDWSDLVVLGSLSPVSGALEQVLVRDIRIEPDRVFGAAVTYWRDRYGFRAQAALSRSSLTVGGAVGSDRERLAADVDSWFYDVRGAIGLVEYSPARKLWPYVFVGLGAITYDLDRTISPPLLTFIERGGTRRDARGDIVIVEEDGREFILAVDELALETVLALNFGAGCDFRLPLGGGGLGLRVEVSDHVSSSPLGLRVRELGTLGGLGQEDAVRFGTVHHLRAAAGLVVQVGR